MGAVAAAIPAVLSTITGLIGGNQARQDAKHAQDLTNQGVDSARQNYDARSGLRGKSMNDLLNPKSYDLSSVYGGGPEYASVDSPLLTQGRGAQSATLADLTNGPNVADQVRQTLKNFDAEALPQLAAGRRAVGQSAASLGRIGSGGVTTSLGDLQSAYEKNRGITESTAIQDAINQAQANKYKTLDAAGNIVGQSYGQGATDRSNRQGVAQQGVTNRANQFGAERNAQGQDFGQGVSMADLGFSNDPSNALFRGAGVYNGSSANNAAGAGDAMGVAGLSLAKLLQPKSAGFSGAGAGSGVDPSIFGIG